MIKIDTEGIEIKGIGLEVRAEVTMLMRKFIESHIIDKDELHDLIDLASMSNEEIQKLNEQQIKEAEKVISEMSQQEFNEIMDRLLGALGGI